MKMQLVFFALAIPAVACGQSVTSCPMHDPHEKSAEQHAAAVDSRGDHAMGFSHERSAHHFRILSDGGAIEVDASDAADTVTRDEIRSHLKHIAEMFASGNFKTPMFIHDVNPPGVPMMESKRDLISYLFEPTPKGGRVVITTADPTARTAIHQFLDFQIDDHRTGDRKGDIPPGLTK